MEVDRSVVRIGWCRRIMCGRNERPDGLTAFVIRQSECRASFCSGLDWRWFAADCVANNSRCGFFWKGGETVHVLADTNSPTRKGIKETMGVVFSGVALAALPVPSLQGHADKMSKKY